MADPCGNVDLSVVLPAYQEEENLRLLLPRICAVLPGISGNAEVVVVDTRSPLDATELVCEQYGARYVRRSPSDSFGDAVRVGIEQARGQWILFMDADGSHGPEWIPRLLAERDSSDIVIASRYTSGGSTENSPLLVFMSWILNVTYSVVLGLKVKDVSNSFKVYRAGLLKSLSLRCQNFDIIEEILFKIRRAHPEVRMTEIPFTFKARMFGRTKRNLLWFMVTYIGTMLRLRFFNR
jgi:dolichol-phosphate mannosyltransferase